MPVQEDFMRLAAPFRTELMAYCYRMLGSTYDAEDLVQETYLRGWRSYEGFEGRASLRTWLYRIATSTCLRALENRARRALPSGLAAGSADPDVPLDIGTDSRNWVTPFPDSWWMPEPPEAAFEEKQSVRLALVAALQVLPARQRAILILRDVVQFSASEVARLLDTTPAAVNSALQRARIRLSEVGPTEDETVEPTDQERRDLIDRYAAAFEQADTDALTRVLRADVRLEMPPLRAWFSGREPVTRFLASRALAGPGGVAMVPTHANGRAALAAYRRDATGVLWAHALHVLEPGHGGMAGIVAFLAPELFPAFGLPPTHRRAS